MLYPHVTETRRIADLNGMWKLKFDEKSEGYYNNWKEEYNLFFRKLKNHLGTEICRKELTFELIQHYLSLYSFLLLSITEIRSKKLAIPTPHMWSGSA